MKNKVEEKLEKFDLDNSRVLKMLLISNALNVDEQKIPNRALSRKI